MSANRPAKRQKAAAVSRQRTSTTQFTEHLICGGFTYGFGLQACDLDGDGFLDLTVADTYGFVHTEPFAGEAPAASAAPVPHNSHMYWFKNDGKGNFTRHFIAKNDVARRLERHVIADMNNDGRPDVVVVDNFLGDVLWYENPGPAALARGQPWKKHFVAKGSMFGAEDVTVADFDGDGYLDVAAAGWRLGNCFKWFKNPGPGHDPNEEWAGWTIDGGFPVARCILAGDINGDGRPDLFATSDTSRAVIWYENPADPTTQPWRRHVIDLTAGRREPGFGKLVDLNGDGRLDVVLAWGGWVSWDQEDALATKNPGGSKGAVIWYENAGMADGRIQWKKHLISDDLPGACDVAVADLNGDGRLDVVAIGVLPGEIAWFENPGNPSARWTKHPLKRNWPNINQVIVADLDNDGRPDIVAIADYGSMEMRWWRHEG
ncbi:MAG: VCBS repeat-containing protein [Opitutaceae bacterium]|nr:VCBS repeat-containing protein [Opitutaceae bacterium]